MADYFIALNVKDNINHVIRKIHHSHDKSGNANLLVPADGRRKREEEAGLHALQSHRRLPGKVMEQSLTDACRTGRKMCSVPTLQNCEPEPEPNTHLALSWSLW